MSCFSPLTFWKLSAMFKKTSKRELDKLSRQIELLRRQIRNKMSIGMIFRLSIFCFPLTLINSAPGILSSEPSERQLQ